MQVGPHFGVESQARTATAALAANAAEMRKVIAAVKAAGGTDVKTQSVSLSPRYNEKNEPVGLSARAAAASHLSVHAR